MFHVPFFWRSVCFLELQRQVRLTTNVRRGVINLYMTILQHQEGPTAQWLRLQFQTLVSPVKGPQLDGNVKYCRLSCSEELLAVGANSAGFLDGLRRRHFVRHTSSSHHSPLPCGSFQRRAKDLKQTQLWSSKGQRLGGRVVARWLSFRQRRRGCFLSPRRLLKQEAKWWPPSPSAARRTR